VTNPAASGGWTQLSGTYAVPTTGVDGVRMDLTVLPAATGGGTVWFDDGSVTKVQLFSETWTAGLTGDINNLTTGVDARALQTDVISLVNAIGTGSYSSIPGSLSDITTRLQNLLNTGLFDAEQLFNVANMPMLSIGSVPTSDLGLSNIADLSGLNDAVTNALLGLAGIFTGTSLTQSTGSLQSIYENVITNAEALSALQAAQVGQGVSGTSTAISFSNYPNGAMPSIFTQTYSGTGVSILGVNSGDAQWLTPAFATPPANETRTAFSIYNVAPTNTDYQIVTGSMAAPPTQPQFGYVAPRIAVLGRVDNPANPQNYVWARGYCVGFLNYQADIGHTVAGVDYVWQSAIPLTWALNMSMVYGVGGNPRRCQLYSGTTLVKDIIEPASGTPSLFGPGYRYWGAKSEMKAGPSVSTTPGTIAGTSVSDNAAPAVRGSSFRVYRSSTTTLVTSGATTAPMGAFFDTLDYGSADLSWDGTNLTIGQEGTYIFHVRYSTPVVSGSVDLDVVLYRKRGGGAQTAIRYMGSMFSDAVSTHALGLDGLAEVYCLAGDVITPGYAVTGTTTFTGEATGTRSYFEAALANMSYA
jgi:hypothetical protein